MTKKNSQDSNWLKSGEIRKKLKLSTWPVVGDGRLHPASFPPELYGADAGCTMKRSRPSRLAVTGAEEE